MKLAKRSLNFNGTVVSIEKTNEFKDKETGEVTPISFKICLMENVGTDENVKTEITKIKISDVTEENVNDINKLNMKEVNILNVASGKYKDNNGVYQDWYRTELKNLKLVG